MFTVTICAGGLALVIEIETSAEPTDAAQYSTQRHRMPLQLSPQKLGVSAPKTARDRHQLIGALRRIRPLQPQRSGLRGGRVYS